ncbi:MAG TPA: zinc-binding dehydrogenase [Trebonia sp.]|jgi:NADPH2:quinone reductase|nr:zinc-binding dehydrogenase [Trebonia sp.]
MRAVIMRRFGPPGVLEPAAVPSPVPGAGEVAVEVKFAGVTFVETQIRAGRPPRPEMLPALPAILGNGVGGTVTEAGDGVDRGLTGRRVVASLNGTGGYASRTVTDTARLLEVPGGVELRDAVALLADGRTALSLAELAEVRPGDTVLVEAAAGGVGTLLVQLARNAGARVAGLARGERKLGIVRGLGADVAVDYGDGDWPQRVRDAVGGVDVVFDGVGGEIGRAAFGLLRPGGRFCPFGMASGSFAGVTGELALARQVTVRAGFGADPAKLREFARTALAEAAAGRIRPVIGQEVELERAAEAHAAIEARATIGKTLLAVSS